MNKILMISCGVLMMSSVAMADETATETCANGAGTVVIGAVTEHKYCMSKPQMNWWNAHAWCDALGLRMFDMNDCACSDTIDNCTGRNCPELVGKGDKVIWTATPIGTDRAYNIILSSGGVQTHDIRSGAWGTFYALCVNP